MMRAKVCELVVLFASCFGILRAQDFAVPTTHPDSIPLPGANTWLHLFATDLYDAIAPSGVWAFQNGILSASKDHFIWTKRQLGDCVIDLEFNNSPGANSGVFVYGSDPADWIANSVEIQILDDSHPKWADVPDTWRCGGIFGHLAPAKSAVKPPGQWNRMTITCKGPRIWVLLNGETVTELDMRKWTTPGKNPDGTDIPPWYTKTLAELPTTGHIGLQGKHGEATVVFRNLRVRSLPTQ